MAQMHFTVNLARQVSCPDADIAAGCVAELFDRYFERWPEVRGYVLDDQGALRKHVRVLIDGLNLRDRNHLSDTLQEDSEVNVFQALSGG